MYWGRDLALNNEDKCGEAELFAIQIYCSKSLQKKQWWAKPLFKLYFDNFIKWMTCYYILKFACSFSETRSLLCNGTLKASSSAIAAPSHSNEWSPVRNRIFIALTASQMPKVLGGLCLNECRGMRVRRAGCYQALMRCDSSLQGHSALADSRGHWGSMELNGVPGRARVPWKQSSLSADTDSVRQAMHCRAPGVHQAPPYLEVQHCCALNSCQKWHKSSSNSASDLCCPPLSPCL